MNTSLLENLSAGVSRRQFLQAGAGLTLGFSLPSLPAFAAGAADKTAAFAPNAFLRITPDNRVTVVSKHLEMGQGTDTGLSTIVAEELDADWSQVRVEGAPADASRYANTLVGGFQITGGSTSIANSWTQLRQAGAAARAMLVAAAAKRWQVAPEQIRVNAGVVSHAASGRQASFGELAEAAAGEPVPAQVTLKAPEDFKLIGKRLPRQDSRAKTDGSARFTQDVFLPGMLVAVVAHPTRFGGKVKTFDARAARAIKGVVEVVQIASGIAVLATDTWSAKRGRDALKIEWDDSAALRLGSDELFARYHELAKTHGAVARKTGDSDAAFAGKVTVTRAAYDLPYLAHAAMEPMNCVMRLDQDGCEVWNGEQNHSADQYAVAGVFGLRPEQVKINMLYAGGSFGRRACTLSDYLVECALIVKAIAGRAPVKLVRLREDDMRAGFYRPMYHHAMEAAIDNGKLVGWRHRIVGQSIVHGTPLEKMLVKDGVDVTSVEGAANLPYAIPAVAVDLHTPTDIPVPVLWWRSVGSSHNAFVTETFFDQVAAAAGQDPLAMRLALLGEHPRHAAVLRLAAEKAGWGQPLSNADGIRRGRGVAVHESFHSYVAEVAEVSVNKDGTFKVERVVCAVDCGIAVNPDVIRAQVEGAVGFALSALVQQITLKDGEVEQGNFDSFPVLRIADMPAVEVYIVPSTAAPTGIGEPGVPPLAPAVVNALFAATGKRLTRLPVDTGLLAA